MEKLILINRLYKLPEELKHIALLNVARAILYASLNIFLPIYVFYTYGLKMAILFIALKYSVFYTFVSIKILRGLSSRIPLEIMHVLSMCLGILSIVFLFLIEGVPGLVVSALLFNIQHVLYWLPKHYAVVRYAHTNEKVEESVIVDNSGRIASILAPFVSSYVIYFLGYSLYYVTITFCIVSLLVYILHRMRRKSTYISNMGKVMGKYPLLFILEGFVNAGFIVMVTVLLFYYLGSNVQHYGIMRSIGIILTIFLTYYLAKKIDAKRNLTYSLISFMVLAFLGAIFIFSSFNPFIISMVSALMIFFYNLGLLAPISFIYNYSKLVGEGIILWREIFLSLGRTIALSLYLVSLKFLILFTFVSILYFIIFYSIYRKHLI